MGNRWKYIIYYTVDYDGYDVKIAYIGSSRKAAMQRYAALYEQLVYRYYLNENINEDDIARNYHNPNVLVEGQTQVYSSISDHNDCYVCLIMKAQKQHRFDLDWDEQRYKELFPDAKY